MIHSGCDSSVSRFSFAVVILVQQDKNEHRHNQHLNNHALHTTTPPSTTTPPPSSPLAIQRAPRGHDLRGTGERSGVAAARVRKDISRPYISRENLPPETPARISPARIFLRIVVVLGEKGEGWRSSPDWWMRGVTRPGRRNAPLPDFSGNAAKGGGARNGAGRKAERRAEPRTTKGSYVADAV